MQLETRKLLDDMRDAAQFILDTTQHATEAEYRRNRMLRQSSERNFEIIGEALRRLSQRDSATVQQISGYPQIIAFRNVLVHGYDVLDAGVVWQVIQRDLPVLLAEVITLLSSKAQP